jgi:hypothetical protein
VTRGARALVRRPPALVVCWLLWRGV